MPSSTYRLLCFLFSLKLGILAVGNLLPSTHFDPDEETDYDGKSLMGSITAMIGKDKKRK